MSFKSIAQVGFKLGNSAKGTDMFVKGNIAYILNPDHTILLRYEFNDRKPFEEEVKFSCSSFEGEKIYMADKDTVVFEQESPDFKRTKTSPVPSVSFSEIDKTFQSLYKNSPQSFILSDKVLELLENDLSHTEFVGRDGKLIVAQRDIYRGETIEIEQKERGGFFGKLVKDFGRKALRTKDFTALFLLAKSLSFSVGDEVMEIKEEISKGNFGLGMKGVISNCVYDELYGLTIVGKKVPEKKEPEKGKEKKNKSTPIGTKIPDREALFGKEAMERKRKEKEAPPVNRRRTSKSLFKK